MEIQALCDKLEVFYYPVIFQSTDLDNKSLVVFPLLTWYEPQFSGRTTRSAMEGFDAACRFDDPDTDVTSFFLGLNQISQIEKMVDLKASRVATFSHFLPRVE